MKSTINLLSTVLKIIIFLTACYSSKQEVLAPAIEELNTPSSANASLPYLIKGNDNLLYMSWVEKNDSGRFEFYYSSWEETKWLEKKLISSGNNWFVNWADYPMLAVDNEGNMMAHYLEKSSQGTYSYDVKLVIKPKDSTKWSNPIIPHTDGTPTEHGFVTMLPNDDQSFTIAWLDGRKTGGGEHDDHGHGGSMTLRSAVVKMNGELSEEIELDGRVCDCCQTSGVIMRNEPLFVYRDRSVDEIRDMAFVSKSNGEWNTPQLVSQDNWNIAGCPVNGPRMASSDSTLAVAWFTGALNQEKVKVAFKNKAEFDEAIIVDNTIPIGRVDVVMINNESVVVSWLDGGDTPAIKYRLVSKDGSMSPPYLVAETSKDRGAGFPQMELHDDVLYFAWTEMGENNRLKVERVKLLPL